jgi:serine protease Do
MAWSIDRWLHPRTASRAGPRRSIVASRGGLSLYVTLLLTVACTAALQHEPGKSPVCAQAAASTPVPSVPGLAAAEALQSAFTQVAERVSKSVVAIRVESRRKLENPFEGFPFGEWFGAPNGRPQDRYQVQRGTGSGFVIRADGYILTNRHVVENATRVEVVFRDGSKLVGTSVGVDEATDLAVVKVDAKNLQAASLGDSSKARPGQWVMAIGSPFGLDYSVTVGVVSATGRGGVGINEIEDYLQTDASINPGNSGGPLVNLQGEVLGINTMIVGQGTGIGFAIASNIARNVAEQLINKGSVHRAYIGVAFQELTPELAKNFGLAGKSGALVSSVVKGGPADKSGIVPGDVIVSVDGKAIGEGRDLMRLVLQKQIGSKVNVGVVRDKQERSLTLVTVERPSDAQARAGGEAGAEQGAARQTGLQLQALTPELAKHVGYDGKSGVLVTDVAHGSPAEHAGLQQGDVIVEADRKAVTTPADVDACLADGSALLRVRRREAALYVVLSKNE